MAETEEVGRAGVAAGAAAGAVSEDEMTPSERETVERFMNMSEAEVAKWIRDYCDKRMWEDRLSYIP